MKKIIFLILLHISLLQCTAQFNAFDYQIQKKATGTHGAVVSAHPLASKIGLEILQEGGNAFDAAIATQFALAVVYPGAGNIGGGGFLLAHQKNGDNIALDYREKAPLLASRDMYLDKDGNPVRGKSEDGHLSVGVPGTIAGIFATLPYAHLSLKQLINPAIQLAKLGFAISARQAKDLNALRDSFKMLNTVIPAFVKEGIWKKGDTLIQTDLAKTLERIWDEGAKGFYEGITASLILQEMERGKGLISKQDLKEYKAVRRTPVSFDFNQHQVLTMPLPSSGGIILEQLLKMVMIKRIDTMSFQSAEAVQLMIEAERRAFADRAKYLGDGDFVKVPVHQLTTHQYLTERMLSYQKGKAGNSNDTREGHIPEHEETTHISIVDNEGNAVSLTTTLNGSYGSKTVVGGAGFLLNNEMDDFSVKPGVPNLYGSIGSEANAIAPGKRMLSSMTPAIILKNGQPFLVVGTPGGTTIPTSVFQSILNILVFGKTPEEAVNLPKFHHQWLPDQVYVEGDFPSETSTALKQMGYTITPRGPIGRTELIQISHQSIIAVGDKRGDDDAEGY